MCYSFVYFYGPQKKKKKRFCESACLWVDHWKVSHRAPRHQASRPGPVSFPFPSWLTVSVFLGNAAAPLKAYPHCPLQQGLCKEKQGAKLTEILKAFFSLFSFFSWSPSLFFLHPYTEITSAWPRSDTVSILFLINLAHWHSLLNNKACPFFFLQRGDILISVRRGDLGLTPDLDFSFAGSVQLWGDGWMEGEGVT